jgi:hypothetical protein
MEILFKFDEQTTDQDYKDLLEMAEKWYARRINHMMNEPIKNIDEMQSFIVKNNVDVVYFENKNKRCSLCQWWMNTKKYFSDDDTEIGICSNSKIHEYLRAEMKGEHENLLAKAVIKTNADFGCISFEQNKDLIFKAKDLKTEMVIESERLKAIQKHHPEDWAQRIAGEMVDLKKPKFDPNEKFEFSGGV